MSNNAVDTERTALLPKKLSETSQAFQKFCAALGIDDKIYLQMTKDGIYQQIQSSIKWQRGFYYTWTVLAVILVILQLGIGFTISLLTGLRGEKARTAVIILGAVNSFVGGLAAILQYRGQPARSAKTLQALQEVTDGIHEEVGNFLGDDNYSGTAAELIRRFSKAKSNSFANEPLVYDRIINSEPQQPRLQPDGNTVRRLTARLERRPSQESQRRSNRSDAEDQAADNVDNRERVIREV